MPMYNACPQCMDMLPTGWNEIEDAELNRYKPYDIFKMSATPPVYEQATDSSIPFVEIIDQHYYCARCYNEFIITTDDKKYFPHNVIFPKRHTNLFFKKDKWNINDIEMP